MTTTAFAPTKRVDSHNLYGYKSNICEYTPFEKEEDISIMDKELLYYPEDNGFNEFF